jgi:hypothetical protein
MKKVKIHGADKVLRNLNKELKKIETVTMKRLYTVGLLIKERSIEITPAKTGNLRGSAYCTLFSDPTRPCVEIGYTASYALYVHEMPTTYNYTTPGTGPKFLEKAVNRSRKEIIAYLSRNIV